MNEINESTSKVQPLLSLVPSTRSNLKSSQRHRERGRLVHQCFARPLEAHELLFYVSRVRGLSLLCSYARDDPKSALQRAGAMGPRCHPTIFYVEAAASRIPHSHSHAHHGPPKGEHHLALEAHVGGTDGWEPAASPSATPARIAATLRGGSLYPTEVREAIDADLLHYHDRAARRRGASRTITSSST